jgi:glycosyltransferase involved in cell wall biosynthesis
VTAPLFSIIVPTLNVAATLRDFLDSVARQTCSDFELVLVDGGSTDGTPDIANRHRRRLHRRLHRLHRLHRSGSRSPERWWADTSTLARRRMLGCLTFRRASRGLG